jgi:hypothetical protein
LQGGSRNDTGKPLQSCTNASTNASTNEGSNTTAADYSATD